MRRIVSMLLFTIVLLLLAGHALGKHAKDCRRAAARSAAPHAASACAARPVRHYDFFTFRAPGGP